jgi:protein TonB
MGNFEGAFARNVLLGSFVVFLFSGSGLLAQDSTDKTSEAVYEIGDGVTAPKPVYTPDPEYAERARRKKIHGAVLLEMIVTAEGGVRDLKVMKSLDPGLDKQAIAAVRTWRFEPATKDGKPVAAHLKTEVDFRLY